MANRMKEDEKNEKIIRGLLKLPANRRCINCNSLGPQYVCTNFWTFVCTTCSGIHREFTHRVKSVSMAKFTSQEVNALQGGGNERAKEVFFKDWDSQRHSVPDSSNVERLRDFIKHCYVDRRYTGERGLDKPPRSKMGDKEDSIENRRVDAYRSGSRSPPYEDTNDHYYGERPGPAGRNDERRSPGYGQETRYGDSRKSPVDDWRRDDRFGNGRRSEERRYSDGESKFEVRSPDSQKDLGLSSPPLVRPVRDILGEDGPPLRIGEPPKANGGKVAEGFTQTQRTASSSSLGSIDGNPVEPKKETLASLIDFDADPEPPNVGIPPAQQVTTTMAQSVTHPKASPSSDGGNWASFDFTPPAQVQTPAPPNANSLDSVLSQLSVPSTTPFGNMATTAVTGNSSALHASGGVAAGPGGNLSTLPVSGGFSAVAPGGMRPTMPVDDGESFFRANEGGQWSGMQQQHPSLFAATDSQSITPQFTSFVSGAANNQPWNSQAQNVQGPLATSGQTSSSGGLASKPASGEAKPTGREALPEDLFAATLSAYPAPVQSWHTGPSHGMGYGVQHSTAVQMATFPHQSKPANPFDFNNEPTMVHAQSFPSMTSLQGALPNVAAPSGLMRTSSFNAPSPQWMTPQSFAYASAGQSPAYGSAGQSPAYGSVGQSPAYRSAGQSPAYRSAGQSPAYGSAGQSPAYGSAGQSPAYGSAGQSPSFTPAVPPSAFTTQQTPSNMPTVGHQGFGGFGGFGGDANFYGSSAIDQQLPGRYSQPPPPQNSYPSHGGNPFG